MKTKVAFFIQNFSRGAGSERVTAIVANELAKRGYEITIISVCGDNTSFYPLNKNISLFTLIKKQSVDNKRSFFDVKRKYEDFLATQDIALVIDVFASMSVYTNLVKRKYGIKNITWEHYNYLNNMGFYWINRKIAIKFSDFIITLTETDKNYYLANNPGLREKVDFIFNPSPFQDVFFDEARSNVVLAVGRLVHLKGFHHLLDVWKLVESVNDVWWLKIVGSGEEYENLLRKTKKLALQRVEFSGSTSNISKFYKEASILVSTSDKEGLPMNMIEAQSFGIPIVSFDYETGPKEIISHEKDGFIVFENNQTLKNIKMANYILTLINDSELRHKMSINSFVGGKRFLINPIVDKWEATIQRLLKFSVGIK